MKPSTCKPSTINHPAFAWLLLGVLMLLAVLLFAAVQPALADPGWYDRDWAYRKSITIQVSQVEGGSDLSNFPVLISFTDTDLAADAQDNGNDILFTSSDETTKLSHEIEKFVGGTGELVAWVKVNPLSCSANTVLYMYYGNSECGSQQDATNVWDDNYKGVWHLLGDGTTALPDATGTNAGTKQAAGPANTALGQIDGAQDFAGVANDYVDCGDVDIIDGETAVTFSAWVKTGTHSHHGIISKAVSDDRSFFFFLRTGTSYPGLDLKVWDGSTSNNNYIDIQTDNDVVPLNTWTHIVGHIDLTTNANSYFYVNGVSQDYTITTDGTPPTSIANTASAMEIGRLWDGVYEFTGIIDEVRISASARSGDWIKTGYNNQHAPGTFSTRGDEVTNWESYSDSGRTVEDDDFTSGQYYVYMKGSGFSTSETLKVGYYDGGNALRAPETFSGGVTGGILEGQCYFPTSGGVSGTWHAVVLQQGANLPDTYAAAIADANYIIKKEFTVASEPLPEFPTVVTAIAVCMLCAVAYVVMRRKVGKGDG